MYLILLICFNIVNLVFSSRVTCDVGRIRYCNRQLAMDLGLGYQLPKNVAELYTRADYITEQHGQEFLCGITYDFLECIGTQIAVCSEVQFAIQYLDLDYENAMGYRKCLSDFGTMCATTLEEKPAFVCQRRYPGSFHTDQYDRCGTGFFHCGNGDNLPFYGLCRRGRTIDLYNQDCLKLSQVRTCSYHNGRNSCPDRRVPSYADRRRSYN